MDPDWEGKVVVECVEETQAEELPGKPEEEEL